MKLITFFLCIVYSNAQPAPGPVSWRPFGSTLSTRPFGTTPSSLPTPPALPPTPPPLPWNALSSDATSTTARLSTSSPIVSSTFTGRVLSFANSSWNSSKAAERLRKANATASTQSTQSTTTWSPSTQSTTRTWSTRSSTGTTTFPAILAKIQALAHRSTPTPEPPSPVLITPAFTDYEEWCPDNMPVRAFSYKIFDNGVSKDYVLTALCLKNITFGNKQALNLSDAQCSYRKAFSVEHDEISETDQTHMCGPGEYVSGAQSEYWEGTRLIRLRCCKSPQLQLSSEFGCKDWTSDQVQGMLQWRTSLTCPIEVLTSVKLTPVPRDASSLLLQYCGLSQPGSQFTAICDNERRGELDYLNRWKPDPDPMSLSRTDRINRGLTTVVKPDTQTDIDSNFFISCADYEAIDAITITRIGDEFAFTFGCQPVAPKLNTRVEQSASPFRSDIQMLSENDHCGYENDYVLCGVDSFVGKPGLDGSAHRQYSYLCCRMANAELANRTNGLEMNRTIFNKDDFASISRPGYFLEGFRILYKKNLKFAILITDWSAFNSSLVPLRSTFTVAKATHRLPNWAILWIIAIFCIILSFKLDRENFLL